MSSIFVIDNSSDPPKEIKASLEGCAVKIREPETSPQAPLHVINKDDVIVVSDINGKILQLGKKHFRKIRFAL
jgi:hypothetical protein